jgi:hypothetical protein
MNYIYQDEEVIARLEEGAVEAMLRERADLEQLKKLKRKYG